MHAKVRDDWWWHLKKVKDAQEGRMVKCKMRQVKGEKERRWGEREKRRAVCVCVCVWGGGGGMNNPLENHERIRARWEPKIYLAKAAWCNNCCNRAQHNSSCVFSQLCCYVM